MPVIAAAHAGRLLPHGARGLPHGGEVHDAGDRALGRLPREQRRALADPRRRRPRAHARSSTPTRSTSASFQPYSRDPETLARPWAIPGTPGLEHRIGGLTKQDGSGNVTYDADNHAQDDRAARSRRSTRIARHRCRPSRSTGPTRGELLVVGWGGTHGAITAAVEEAREDGLAVSQVHLRHLNPFPTNLGEVLARFEKVLVPELNDGQLAMLLRAEVPRRRPGAHQGRRPALQGRPRSASASTRCSIADRLRRGSPDEPWQPTRQSS